VIGFGPFAMLRRRVAAAGGAPVPANLVSEFLPRGWSGQWIGAVPDLAPNTAPLFQPLQRAGFDANLQPTWISDPLIPTIRVRNPGGLSGLTESEVAFHDYPYRDDVAEGVTNNAPLRSPKSIIQWSSGHRDHFKRFLTLRCRAIHRNARLGQEIRGVRWRVTSLVNSATVEGISTVVALSQMPGDWWWEEEFIITLDCESLPDGDVKADLEGFPWFGVDDATYAESSVFKSAEFHALSASKLRGPCTRFFRKRAAGVPRCFIDPVNGTDTQSVAGWALDNTNSAVAYRTTRVAMLAARNAANTGVTQDVIEGEFCLVAGATTGLLGLSTAQQAGSVGAVIFTHDPAADPASITFQIGASGIGLLNLTGPVNRPEASAIIIRNIPMQRSDGTSTIRATTGAAGLELWLDNVPYDTRGIFSDIRGASTVGFITGLRPTNSLAGGAVAGTSLSSSGTTQCWALIRGYRGAQGATLVDVHNVGWARFDSFGGAQPIAMGEGPNGGICFGDFRNPIVGTGTEYFSLAMGTGGGTVEQFALGGLFKPTTDATSDPGIRIAGDADNGANQSTRHICLRPLINTGAASFKRCNIAYSGNGRTHELWSIIGWAVNQFNVKSELFEGIAEIGNWSLVHGVGIRGLVTLYEDAADGGTTGGFRRFSPEFMGLGSVRSLTIGNWLDPGVTTWGGLRIIDGVKVDGAGGGDYTPLPGSILIGRVSAERRSRGHDYAGVPITGADNAGLYMVAD